MKQFWIALQSAEFKRGYDDCCALLPRDNNQTAEYLRGYDKARDDNEHGDYA